MFGTLVPVIRNLAPGICYLESGAGYFAPGTWNLTTWHRTELALEALCHHLAFPVAAACTCLIAANCAHFAPLCSAYALRHCAHFASSALCITLRASIMRPASFVLVQQCTISAQLLLAALNIWFVSAAGLIYRVLPRRVYY